MCSAGTSGELNVWSESEGILYASQAAGSYLRFPVTASACADWFLVWVMYESMLRLNLYAPKLCATETCSTHMFVIVLHICTSICPIICQQDIHRDVIYLPGIYLS